MVNQRFCLLVLVVIAFLILYGIVLFAEERKMTRYDVFLQKNKESRKLRLQSFAGDVIRPWLQGFVNYFGRNMTLYFLEDAGHPYNKSTALEVIQDV